MKFLLIKTLLLRRAKDEGFTLPIVMAIGLVMLLLSTVNLVQSGEEQLLTLSKQGSSEALASAEFGIARYRELLNNNRVLAVYNLDQWTNANVAGQTCDDVTGTGGWADNTSTSWKSVTALNESTLSVDLNNDGDTSDSESIGQYQIVNYEYDNDGVLSDGDDNGDINLVSDAINDDGTPPRGLLTVKGLSRDGSAAQIEVEIPLGVNTFDLESLDPALWIRQGDATAINFGNITLNSGNIVLYRESASSTGCDNFTEGTITGIRDPRQLPPIVDLTDLTVRDITTGTGTTVNYFQTVDITEHKDDDNDPNTPADNDDNDLSADDTPVTLPYSRILLGTDYDDSGATQALNDGRYYYTTGNSDLVIDSSSEGQLIQADGLGKVILYVGGDLTVNTNLNTIATHDIRFNNYSNLASSRYLEIHVNGDVIITGDGNLEIRGLLHVPNGTVTIRDSANVKVRGSIWANDWDNQSLGTVTIETDDYKFYSITPNRTPKPLTYRPSNWETQEVQ